MDFLWSNIDGILSRSIASGGLGLNILFCCIAVIHALISFFFDFYRTDAVDYNFYRTSDSCVQRIFKF